MPVEISIPRTRGKGKQKVTEKRKAAQEMLKNLNANDLDVKVAMIQALIPCGLAKVEEDLQEAVDVLTGQKRKHGKENLRWGSNPGSVYLYDQKIPIVVPRVRNKHKNIEMPLEAYQKLQSPYQCDKKTMLKLLNGISTHKYKESVELVPEVFGLSPSNLSKRLKKNTIDSLKRLKTRSLEAYDFICVFIDGKRYADQGILIALGITTDGEKIIMDIEQSHSESSLVTAELFDRLIERGLRYEEGLLFIIDGSKGIAKAITQKFQEYGFIQRCTWHKQQNVASYLSKFQAELSKRDLKKAYKKTSYKEAKEALDELHKRLSIINESAANSLLEGLEETLTLHRLGLSPELCRSLSSTNCIESIMSQIAQFTDKVDYWQNSNQILRWNAASLMEIEPNLRKIRGFRYLNILRHKMKQEIKKRQEKKYGSIKKDEPVLQAIES